MYIIIQDKFYEKVSTFDPEFLILTKILTQTTFLTSKFPNTKISSTTYI